MSNMKTPGVYIVEKNAFANSVVEVATAVPAFIGYTEKAEDASKNSLLNKPLKVTSLSEFQKYFGGEPKTKFSVKKRAVESITSANPAKGTLLNVSSETVYDISRPDNFHTLYHHLCMFFANGGGTCYIVSVGHYAEACDADKLKGGIEALVKEQEPTMVLVPEATLLKEADCLSVQQQMLMHCGKMKNRICLLDVWNGQSLEGSPSSVENFRSGIGENFLNYGVAYTPWLLTSVVSDKDMSVEHIAYDDFKEIAEKFISETTTPTAREKYMLDLIQEYVSRHPNATIAEGDTDNRWTEEEAQIKGSDLHLIMIQNWPLYKGIIDMAKDTLNVLPPSSSMAGVYTMVDNNRGVWKAPANVTLANVVKPTDTITSDTQEDLNMPMNGKAVNAIRFFIGEGVKVWGARTLNGNSGDWRFVNVRRTMIYLEESVKNAARAYVFEPNDANTWVNMKSMIGNFLNSVWKRGGLAGATPEDAYSVQVGLGETMTAEDILDGTLRITVLAAISRPAEFIEITFQQQMQKS